MLDAGQKGDAMFNEKDLMYTPEDIRFTVKGDTLYAIVLDWPGKECLIRTFSGDNGWNPLYRDEISEISMLGDDKPLNWKWEADGLVIETPDERPCDHAFVFKIVRKYD